MFKMLNNLLVQGLIVSINNITDVSKKLKVLWKYKKKICKDFVHIIVYLFMTTASRHDLIEYLKSEINVHFP